MFSCFWMGRLMCFVGVQYPRSHKVCFCKKDLGLGFGVYLICLEVIGSSPPPPHPIPQIWLSDVYHHSAHAPSIRLTFSCDGLYKYPPPRPPTPPPPEKKNTNNNNNKGMNMTTRVPEKLRAFSTLLGYYGSDLRATLLWSRPWKTSLYV